MSETNHKEIIKDKDKACTWYKWTLVGYVVIICSCVGAGVFLISKEILEPLYVILAAMMLVITALSVVGRCKMDYETKWNLYVRTVLRDNKTEKKEEEKKEEEKKEK